MICYLDLDGVLADFDKRFVELFGCHFNQFPGNSVEKWKEIDKHPDLYLYLDKTHDANILVNNVMVLSDEYEFSVGILTAIPSIGRMPLAEQHKKMWLELHFPHLLESFNIGPKAVDKQNHCVPGDILIDDSALNIPQWIARGGVGILHTSAEDSIRQLESHLEEKYNMNVTGITHLREWR